MTVRRATRIPVATATVVSIMLLAAGCAEPEPMPTPTPRNTYVSSYETPAPTELAPLTGEVVAAGSVDNPSLAAKIDNTLPARPQVGLDHTDLVFEELVEGGITRYVAVWQSDIPKEIGPIRSIRPMDPDIVSAFGGIITYSGGQQRFVALMRATKVYNAIHGQSDTADLMYRTTKKTAPHNVIVYASKLVKRHLKIKKPAQQFAFSADVASATATKDGKSASVLRLVFSPISKPTWKYDSASQTYKRSQTAGKDMDSNHKQLSAVNVIVLRVGVARYKGVPKTDLIGSGKAYVSSGGKTISATWSKSSATSAIRLSDSEGVTIRLAPGNSWIELVPNSGSVTLAK
jgi:hypothetical protein